MLWSAVIGMGGVNLSAGLDLGGANLSAVIVALIAAIGTITGAIITVRSNRKAKDEREAARSVDERTADKLEAEREEIAERTRSMLLEDLRRDLVRKTEELADAERKLEAANNRAEQLRAAVSQRDDEIYTQAHTIRRLRVLEEWAERNESRFAELGIEPLPPDYFQDRRANGR